MLWRIVLLVLAALSAYAGIRMYRISRGYWE
jgi:hypothetical protein